LPWDREAQTGQVGILIPSYWTDPQAPEAGVFDHPSDFSGEGTLPRTLQNLLHHEEEKGHSLGITVLLACTHPDSLQKLQRKKEQLQEFFPECHFVTTGEMQQRLLRVETKPDEQLQSLLEPYSYAGIRNGMLFLALEKQLEVAIFLDDDEIIEDKAFFSRCMEGMGETAPDGGLIDGKAGPYLEESPPPETLHEPPCWPKIRVMRQGLARLSEAFPRFKSTMLALGGNMVMHRRVMQAIPFDPLIHRGEDMDYVFNARLRGFRFYFDPLQRIRHLPPEAHPPAWKKAQEDVLRFAYFRDKYRGHLQSLRVHKISFEELWPYPGIFLQDDLEERAKTFLDHVAAETGQTLTRAFGKQTDVAHVLENWLQKQECWKAFTRKLA